MFLNQFTDLLIMIFYPVAISNILTGTQLQPDDVTILSDLYRNSEPPPIALLRSPAIFDLFINYLFIPQQASNMNQDQKSKCVWLFGYAACVWEDWDVHGNRISIDRQEAEIEDTARAIENASNLLLEKEGTMHILGELPTLFKCIRYPSVGLGVLRWVEATTTPKYLEKQVCDRSSV